MSPTSVFLLSDISCCCSLSGDEGVASTRRIVIPFSVVVSCVGGSLFVFLFTVESIVGTVFDLFSVVLSFGFGGPRLLFDSCKIFCCCCDASGGGKVLRDLFKI